MQKAQQKPKPAALPKIASDAIGKQPQRKAVSLPKKLVISKDVVKNDTAEKVLPQVKKKVNDDDKENRIPDRLVDKLKKGKHAVYLQSSLSVPGPSPMAPKTNSEDDVKPIVIAPAGSVLLHTTPRITRHERHLTLFSGFVRAVSHVAVTCVIFFCSAKAEQLNTLTLKQLRVYCKHHNLSFTG